MARRIGNGLWGAALPVNRWDGGDFAYSAAERVGIAGDWLSTIGGSASTVEGAWTCAVLVDLSKMRLSARGMLVRSTRVVTATPSLHSLSPALFLALTRMLYNECCTSPVTLHPAPAWHTPVSTAPSLALVALMMALVPLMTLWIQKFLSQNLLLILQLLRMTCVSSEHGRQ